MAGSGHGDAHRSDAGCPGSRLCQTGDDAGGGERGSDAHYFAGTRRSRRSHGVTVPRTDQRPEYNPRTRAAAGGQSSGPSADAQPPGRAPTGPPAGARDDRTSMLGHHGGSVWSPATTEGSIRRASIAAGPGGGDANPGGGAQADPSG